MASLSNGIIVNSREDLDAIQGRPPHAEFMDMLKGSIYRLEKDDVAKTWVVVKDTGLIEQFGFLFEDFPDVTPPELPTYIPPPSKVPQSVTMRQARLALLDAGLLQSVADTVAAMPGIEGDAARIEWGYAQEVRRDSALLASLANSLQMTDMQIDDLFTKGASL